MKKILLTLALCPLLCCCRGNDTEAVSNIQNGQPVVAAADSTLAVPPATITLETSAVNCKAQEPAPKAEDKPVGHIVAEVIESLCAAIAIMTVCLFTFVASVVIWHKFLEIIS